MLLLYLQPFHVYNESKQTQLLIADVQAAAPSCQIKPCAQVHLRVRTSACARDNYKLLYGNQLYLCEGVQEGHKFCGHRMV